MIKTLPPEVTWFLILHADDLALSCFLERNLAIAASCDERVATVSSEYHHFQSIDDPIPARPYDDRIVFRGDAPEEIRHTALVGCWWHISGALINRAAWEQLNGRDPALPQTGDWDLILRWQTAGYIVGHSLVPTTRYRVNKADSISSRSYVLFRDLRERAEVIARFPEIFGTLLRGRLALRLAATGSRRACRLVVAGQVGAAGRGMLTTMRCVRMLVSS